MEPFEAPDIAPGGAAEIDPAEAIPSILVRVAGISVMAAGAFVAVSGAQMFAFFVLFLWAKVVAGAMIVFGSAAIGAGGFLFQARGWAAWVSLALTGLLSLGTCAWAIYALVTTLFSPLFLFSAVFSVLALILTVIALPSTLRADAARHALYSV